MSLLGTAGQELFGDNTPIDPERFQSSQTISQQRKLVLPRLVVKISSLWVATQKRGSALWECEPLAQRLEVLLGGFGGARGHLRDRSTVPISARVQAASGSLGLCPFPCRLLRTPQNKQHIPPTTNLGCRSWGQRPKGGRNAVGTWWRFRVGVAAPGLPPTSRALSVGHPGGPKPVTKATAAFLQRPPPGFTKSAQFPQKPASPVG